MRSRLTWADHVDRMGDEKLVKRTNAQKVKGKGADEDRLRLRETLQEWGKNGEKEQQIEGIGNC